MTMQIRPRSNPEAAVYSPERDLVNLFLPLLREVLGMVDPSKNTFANHYCDLHGYAMEDVQKLIDTLAASVQEFTRNPAVTCIEDALAIGRFSSLPEKLQHLFYIQLGRSAFAGWFTVYRQATLVGLPSPVHGDLAMFLAAARTATGSEPAPLVAETARLQAENQELRRVIRQQDALLHRDPNVTTEGESNG